jgi:hypothetical protein
MRVEHVLHVSVVSREEAEHSVAEFWAGGELFGFTRLEDAASAWASCVTFSPACSSTVSATRASWTPPQ